MCVSNALSEWRIVPDKNTLHQIDQLVDAAVIQGRGVIQRRGPELDRYCASLSMNQPSQLELLSISVPNDECHKDILWHAYHRFKW